MYAIGLYIQNAMKRILLQIVLIFCALGTYAQKPIVVDLWPDGAPSQSGLTGDEKMMENNFLTNVTKPTISVYQAEKPNGTCIICCPGGGYFGLSMVNEGTGYAEWMNKQGITLVVLKYRMPNTHSEIPLADGEQAIRLVRSHAQEWHINPNKVGIMGHSAGGHFAATLSTLFTSKETRPDFSILLYPVISMKKELTHQGSRELLLGKNPTEEQVKKYNLDEQVTLNTPPAILILATDDDVVDPRNSLLYYEALLKKKVEKSALHIYPTGGHGFGIGDGYKYKAAWTTEVEQWIKNVVH